MAILLNCPLKHINGAVEFFLAHQSRMCEKPLENKNNNYTWYIYIHNRKSIKSESVSCLKNTYITFLTDKKKIYPTPLCFAFDTCAQPHWKCAHVCVYMQVHMHTQTGTTHIDIHEQIGTTHMGTHKHTTIVTMHSPQFRWRAALRNDCTLLSNATSKDYVVLP